MCTTNDEVCRLRNMFCKIKYIYFLKNLKFYSQIYTRTSRKTATSNEIKNSYKYKNSLNI